MSDMNIDKGYVFNRKEAKTYADKSKIVGMPVNADTRLVIVDDVITSGKAIRESLEVLKTCGSPAIKGIVISVDRQEKGSGDKNALKEVAENLDIPIFSIVTITDIKNFLANRKINDKIVINDAMIEKIDAYLDKYGTC